KFSLISSDSTAFPTRIIHFDCFPKDKNLRFAILLFPQTPVSAHPVSNSPCGKQVSHSVSKILFLQSVDLHNVRQSFLEVDLQIDQLAGFDIKDPTMNLHAARSNCPLHGSHLEYIDRLLLDI